MRRRDPIETNTPQEQTAKPQRSRTLLIALIGVIAIGAGAYWSRQQLGRPGVDHDSRATTALAANDTATAEREWQAGIKEDPQFPDSYSKLGDLYMKAHRFKEAIALYQKAITLSPNDGTIDYRLSFAEVNSGDSEAAVTAARTATQLLPNDVTAVRQLGVVAAHAGHGDIAYAAFRPAHELDPTNRTDLLNLSTQGLFEPDLPYDRQELKIFVAAHPDDYQAWYLLSATDERLPRTPSILAEAVEAGEHALTGLPGDIRLIRVLGELYLAANRPADALKTYRKGLASKPDSNEMLHGIAISQERLGHPGTQ